MNDGEGLQQNWSFRFCQANALLRQRCARCEMDWDVRFGERFHGAETGSFSWVISWAELPGRCALGSKNMVLDSLEVDFGRFCLKTASWRPWSFKERCFGVQAITSDFLEGHFETDLVPPQIHSKESASKGFAVNSQGDINTMLGSNVDLWFLCVTGSLSCKICRFTASTLKNLAVAVSLISEVRSGPVCLWAGSFLRRTVRSITTHQTFSLKGDLLHALHNHRDHQG